MWASPVTLVGLVLAGVAGWTGAAVRARQGVIEAGGGALARFVARRSGYAAITLGHVVLGASEAHLDRLRDHEHAHVRQYVRWGALFVPLYLASSLFELARGRHFYRDNLFERQARAAEGRRRPPV